MPAPHHGSTLVKVLLIVGAVGLFCLLVFAALVALLLPSLHRAREQAKAVQCSVNMRQMGQLVAIYAGEHDGRGPGGAVEKDGKAIDWSEILNREILYRAGSGGPGGSSAGASSCPTFILSAKYAGRPYAYNKDAAGGSAGPRFLGLYGIPAGIPEEGDPRSGPPVATPYPEKPDPRYGPPDGKYWYGAELKLFESSQFLIIEQESPNPLTAGGGGAPDGHVTLGGDATYPAYSTPGGTYSFRHPYSRAANFLFFDGHVERLTPRDNIASPSRYDIPVSPAAK